MSAINHLVSKTGNGIVDGLEVASWAMTKNEPLEKVAKITGRVIEMAAIIFDGISAGLANFGSQIKDNVIVLETLRLIGATKLLFTPQERNGKYFLADSDNSWQKRVDRVNLFFHCCFKSYKGLNRFGFASLGVMAKEVIGKLPVFQLTMDSFMLVSCFFSAWDSIGVHYPRALKAISEADRKLEKWESRPMEISFLKANIEEECTHFEPRYQAKVVELNARLEKLEKDARLNEDKLLKATEQNSLPEAEQKKIISACSNEKKRLASEINKVHQKQLQNDERLAKLATGDLKGLAQDLERQDVDLKLKQWEIRKANGKQKQTTIWLRVANSVSKFAAIILALTLVATNHWTVPATAALLVMGIVADSIGLSKLLAEEFWKDKAIPRKLQPAKPALANFAPAAA